jgi:glycosyltransferase involved in cell wall biosynthesis
VNASGPVVLHVAAVDFTATSLLAPQLRFLRARGIDARLACGFSSPESFEALGEFSPINIPFPRSLAPRRVVISALKLAHIVRGMRPAVLHLHTPAVALAVRSLPPGFLPRDTRLVYTVHGFLHLWPTVTVSDKVVQKIEQVQARRTDLMFFQSSEDLARSSELHYASRLRYLGNGVEDWWLSIPPPQRAGGPLQLLYVGRLIREKGILDLIQAMRFAPDVNLIIAGAALRSDRDQAEQEARLQVQRLGLSSRVQFVGMLDRHGVCRVMARSHALVLPSYREGVPRSVIEALAAARPCVVTDIRGSRELVTDGENGYIVPVASVAGLGDALRKLAALPASRYAKLSAVARARAAQHHRESFVFDRLLEGYRELGVD